jgi:hypothetical protein
MRAPQCEFAYIYVLSHSPVNRINKIAEEFGLVLPQVPRETEADKQCVFETAGNVYVAFNLP